MMDLTIDLAEAQSDNDCDEPAPTKGQFKRARSYSSQTTTSDEGDDFQLSSSSSRISKWRIGLVSSCIFIHARWSFQHGRSREKRSPIWKYGLCKEELDQSGSMSIICAVHGSKCT